MPLITIQDGDDEREFKVDVLKATMDNEEKEFQAAQIGPVPARDLLRWIDGAAIVFEREGGLVFINTFGSTTALPGAWVFKRQDGRFFPAGGQFVVENCVKI